MRHGEVDPCARERGVVEPKRRVTVRHRVGLRVAPLVTQRGNGRAKQAYAPGPPRERLLQQREPGVPQPCLLVELHLRQGRLHVVRVEIQDALVGLRCVAPVHSCARVGRARHKHRDDVGGRGVLRRREPVLGARDPGGPLVPALGDLPREQQPRDGGGGFRRPSRELSSPVLARVVGPRRAEIAGVALKDGGIAAADHPLEGLNRSVALARSGRGGGPPFASGGRGWRARLGGPALTSRVTRVGAHFDALVGRAVGGGDAKREHRRTIVPADLGREPVPPVA